MCVYVEFGQWVMSLTGWISDLLTAEQIILKVK